MGNPSLCTPRWETPGLTGCAAAAASPNPTQTGFPKAEIQGVMGLLLVPPSAQPPLSAPKNNPQRNDLENNVGPCSVPVKGSLEERGWSASCRALPFSSKSSPSRFGCSAESHLDLVSPSKLADCREQLQPISFYVNMVEDVKEMGNLERLGQFLKEKCVIVKKILLKKKKQSPSLCICSAAAVMPKEFLFFKYIFHIFVAL